MTIAGRDVRTGKKNASVRGWLRIVGRTASAVLAVSLVVLLAGGAAFAAEDKEKKKKDAGGNFSERNLKKIQKMYELQGEGDIKAAKAILESINVTREKPYGRSKIYQFLGSFAQEEEDYGKAIDFLNKAVAEGGLTEEEELRTLFQVGQLQFKMERYDDAIGTIETWMKRAPEVNGQAYYTLAITYFQAGKPAQALEPAKKAIEVATNPPENWYRLLLALYLEAEKYDEGIELLDEVIIKFPNKTYWTQLAALYNQKDQMDKSLAVQQLARYEGYITEERDLTRMAQMFMVQGLPHRGAAVMKEGLESGAIKPSLQAYQTYSDTLLQSREWALSLEPIAKGGGAGRGRIDVGPPCPGQSPARQVGRCPGLAEPRVPEGQDQRRGPGPHPLRHRRRQRQAVGRRDDLVQARGELPGHGRRRHEVDGLRRSREDALRHAGRAGEDGRGEGGGGSGGRRRQRSRKEGRGREEGRGHATASCCRPATARCSSTRCCTCRASTCRCPSCGASASSAPRPRATRSAASPPASRPPRDRSVRASPTRSAWPWRPSISARASTGRALPSSTTTSSASARTATSRRASATRRPASPGTWASAASCFSTTTTRSASRARPSSLATKLLDGMTGLADATRKHSSVRRSYAPRR
jgi:tetratricopeptide (TPR) repeat protein